MPPTLAERTLGLVDVPSESRHEARLAEAVAEAVTLTLAGIVVFAAGLRFGSVLGAEEFDLMRRANLPEPWMHWLFGVRATLR